MPLAHSLLSRAKNFSALLPLPYIRTPTHRYTHTHTHTHTHAHAHIWWSMYVPIMTGTVKNDRIIYIWISTNSVGVS